MISEATDELLQNLIKELQNLGFSEYEAKAYFSLLKVEPATAYEVSKDAGLPKANSYGVLESLSRKEAVQPVSENPVRYMCVHPDVLFERIAASTERRCARVKEGLKSLSSIPDHQYVWSITGSDAVNARVVQIIDEAREHLWVKASEQALEPHRAAFQRAADRGVVILIILFGTDIEKFSFGDQTKTWLHEGNGIAVGMAPSLITMTRDYEEALVAEVGDQAYGSYTRNRPLVNMADTLIRHEIYFAEIFEIFGQEIQKTFGTALFDLRRKYLPAAQVQMLAALLDSSEDVAVPLVR